jgi:hypothetical protein
LIDWITPRATFNAAGGDIVKSLACLIDQQQVNARALQPVVMVQPLRVDQRHVTLAVLGDYLLGAGLRSLSRCQHRGIVKKWLSNLYQKVGIKYYTEGCQWSRKRKSAG